MKPGGAMRVMLQGTTPWRIRRRLSVRGRQMYVSVWKSITVSVPAPEGALGHRFSRTQFPTKMLGTANFTDAA